MLRLGSWWLTAPVRMPLKYSGYTIRRHISGSVPKLMSSKTPDEKLKEIIESSNLGSQSRQNSIDTTQPRKVQPKEGTTDPSVSTNRRDSNSSANDGLSVDSDPSGPVTDAESFTEKLKQEIRDKVDRLPSQKEEFRYTMSKRFEQYMDSLQHGIFRATRVLNDVTGYSAIEQLRATIDALETDLKKAKENVKASKAAYTAAITERSLSQKEVNELLTRKHNWNAEDLERFTQLYRSDHVNEQNEMAAQQKLNEAEQLVDSIQLKLTQSILSRYHEEQIWSDKIRRASTWGTWGLMGFNVVLFFIATFIVEPWKRRRMVESFEDRVKSAILRSTNEQTGKMDTILTLQTQQKANSDTVPKSVYSFHFPSPSWTSFKEAVILNYRACVSPDVSALQFDKAQLAMILSIISVTSGAFASILTAYFK